MEIREFDVDQTMLRELSSEFSPVVLVKTLDLGGASASKDAETEFENYGRSLAARSVEEGERRSDRSYEVLKQAVAKTGEMLFPLVPQRYVEIAYLSLQPSKRLRVMLNSPAAFSYRVDDCSIYRAITEEYGESAARRMECRGTCLALLDELFSRFNLDVEVQMETEMAAAGSCLFRVTKGRGREAHGHS